MSTYIFTDTTADFNIKEWVDAAKDFAILPLAFSLDEDNYDNIETTLSNAEFYARMRAGAISRTSMVPTYYMEKMFTEQLEKGNDVLYLAVSSGISGCADGGISVAKALSEKYPDRKVVTIDTKLASGGEALMVKYCLDKRDAGASFDELVEYANYLITHIASYFTVTDLKHLARMGRVSNAAALIGSVIKIMPTLYINPIGQLKPLAKVISRKKALKFLVDKFEEFMSKPEKPDVAVITQADCMEDAIFVKDMIESQYQVPVKIGDIGPVIGSHTNAGCIALFFKTNDRVDPSDTNKD